MKTREHTHPRSIHLKPAFLAVCSAVALLSAALLPTAHAGTDEAAKKLETPVDETPLGSKVHALVQVDFGSAYITPRGLNVDNQGVNIQPLLLVFWDLYSSDGFLNDVSLTTGVWNDVGTHATGVKADNWNEIDPIVGLTFKFAKNFQFDAFLDTFKSMTESYPLSNHLDLTLTYHDSFLGDFSINPYVQFFYELHEKATVVLDPATSERGYYFQLGIDPTYSMKAPFPVKFELPTYVSLVSSKFYQKLDGSGGGSGVGVFSSEFKVTVPLTFVSKAYGLWNVYAGFRFDYLNNPGVIDGNEITTTPGQHQHDLYLFHGGFNVFF